MAYNILICDDDRDIVHALKVFLNDPGYRIFEAYNGQELLDIMKNQEVHLILLDIMMPVMDGITALAKVREFSNVPVILLTAKSEEIDMIMGLNLGADDYITKPFRPLEVAARVNSQLRRFTRLGAETAHEDVYRLGGLELDDSAKKVTVDGEEVTLTPKEYEILKLFIASPGKVYAPKEVYFQIWKEAPMPGHTNTVAVHIRHLREKIEIDPSNPRYIKVIFGQGYKMEPEHRKR